MSIIFKLIGCGGMSPPEIKINFQGKIGLKDIQPMFKPILDDTEISNIKFISNHITLTDSTIIEIQSDKVCTIYVFTTIDETKEKEFNALLDGFAEWDVYKWYSATAQIP
jgi:hypothetical protein